MRSQHRDRTMKSKLFGRTALENRIIKAMIAGNINDNINILIMHKLFNRFMKIKRSYEIKLWIIFTELLQQPGSFFFQLFIKRHMDLAVHIHNMKIRLKEIQHSLQISNRGYLFYIF